ncbi:MAG: winged helix-turn-helix domain-containing protein [Alphaproteobacteria bacterium]|nr:winged helix-turn-helix domain-containing protein [Alphaproteobacteria bacterium]
MTKVEAMKQLLADHGGIANWRTIYENIEKYSPDAARSAHWKAGLRGVLYREIKAGKNFKRIGLSNYALKEYQEEPLPRKTDKIRMHSYIEGICLELGNVKKFLTYTADPTALFREKIQLKELATLEKLPDFSYPQILSKAKKIDVIWLNQKGYRFPKKVFEIVDSASTLTPACERCMQLRDFQTECYIVAPEQHKKLFDKKMVLAPFNTNSDKFKFVGYEEIRKLHESAVATDRLESSILNI